MRQALASALQTFEGAMVIVSHDRHLLRLTCDRLLLVLGHRRVSLEVVEIDDVDGIEFCLSLPERIGVVAIPNQVFYAHPEHGRHLVRFACCKRLEVLDQAVERLSALGASA